MSEVVHRSAVRAFVVRPDQRVLMIHGYDPHEPVFVLRFRGGPFDHARSVPIGRDPADYLSNGLFVVIRASDGDVLGSGALRY